MPSVNLETTHGQMTTMVQTREADLTSKMQSADPNDMKQMLDLQHSMQKWTLATNLQTNAMKTLSDGIKSTIQNIR